ncbi:amino acid adenylation, partial [Pseudomonas syringae pv. tagetis]
LQELLATLKAPYNYLTVKDGLLVVHGNPRSLTYNGLLEHLREHKPTLIEIIEQGVNQNAGLVELELRGNGIPQD